MRATSILAKTTGGAESKGDSEQRSDGGGVGIGRARCGIQNLYGICVALEDMAAQYDMILIIRIISQPFAYSAAVSSFFKNVLPSFTCIISGRKGLLFPVSRVYFSRTQPWQPRKISGSEAEPTARLG